MAENLQNSGESPFTDPTSDALIVIMKNTAGCEVVVRITRESLRKLGGTAAPFDICHRFRGELEAAASRKFGKSRSREITIGAGDLAEGRHLAVMG